MIRLDIRPVWRFRSASGERDFDFQLVTILERIDATSKLTHAAESADMSYRHAWNLIADWERFFGAPLVAKEQGRGTRLTPLGKHLLWAARRAQARLEPELENLAADFTRSLDASLSDAVPALVVHASHDYAVAGLREIAGDAQPIELQYKGSFDALAALRRGECDLAGFHVAEGALGELMARRYAECLPLESHRLIAFARREQGFIVRAGNPKGIATVGDLTRGGVRMVNRQRGSGTRALLEFLLTRAGIDRAKLHGYDREETTHAAVAALIAGNQADAGLGVRAAAEQYRLGFVRVLSERYFLACRAEDIDAPAITTLLRLLKSAPFRAMVAALPGYAAPDAGAIVASFDATARAG